MVRTAKSAPYLGNVGSLVRRPESSSLGIVALAPEVLQRFFVTDHHSAFDRSLF